MRPLEIAKHNSILMNFQSVFGQFMEWPDWFIGNTTSNRYIQMNMMNYKNNETREEKERDTDRTHLN